MSEVTDRIERLTSIRGFAALYVVLFHCQTTIANFSSGRLYGVISKGYLAVDFFFVLSGFILAYVYADSLAAGRYRHGHFLGLRLGRIYPVHFVTFLLAALIALAPGFNQGWWLSNDATTAASNLLLLHSWGLDRNLSWNFVSWSISAEWFAYLLFPLFVLATARLRQRPLAALLASLALIAALAALVGPLMRLGVLPNRPEAPFAFAAEFGILRVAFEFAAGVLLYRCWQCWRGTTSALPMVAVPVLSLLLLATLHHGWGERQLWQDGLAVAFMTALVLAVALDRRGLARWLEWRPLVFLGEASYSIYMVHGVAFLAYLALLDAGWWHKPAAAGTAVATAAALVALSIAAGIASYLWIETPARRAAKRWLDR